MRGFRALIPAVAVTAALTAGCMTQDDPNRRAKIGAAVGAVAGAVVGHQLDSSAGRFVGIW